MIYYQTVYILICFKIHVCRIRRSLRCVQDSQIITISGCTTYSYCVLSCFSRLRYHELLCKYIPAPGTTFRYFRNTGTGSTFKFFFVDSTLDFFQEISVGAFRRLFTVAVELPALFPIFLNKFDLHFSFGIPPPPMSALYVLRTRTFFFWTSYLTLVSDTFFAVVKLLTFLLLHCCCCCCCCLLLLFFHIKLLFLYPTK